MTYSNCSLAVTKTYYAMLSLMSEFIHKCIRNLGCLPCFKTLKTGGFTSGNIINQIVKARYLTKPIYVHLLHHFEIHGEIIPLTVAPVTLEAHEQDVWSELANA